MKKFIFLLFSLILCRYVGMPTSEAQIRLPYLFSSGMVLQREQPLSVWGWSDAREKITLVFRGKRYHTTSDSDGRWQVTLPAQKPGGPYEMCINDTTLTDVWVGDVILCTGQSNMELPVSRVMDRYSKEVDSYENDVIHLLHIPLAYSFHGEQPNLPPCQWQALTPVSVMDFSAVGYFLARQIHERTGLPVGIIHNAIGGSTIESWLGEETLLDYPDIANTLGINRNDDYVREVKQVEALRRRLWVNTLNSTDSGCTRWSDVAFPDSGWERRNVFASDWSCDAAGRPVNGSTWWRYHFSATSLDTAQSALLRLGCLVDADSVFVNGAFVGTTSYQYPPRKYTIPAGLLRKTGDNVVAVRLISYTGYPAFVPDKPYKIEQSDCEISLTGEWLFHRGAIMPSLPSETFFHWQPTALYNGMMAPLSGYGIRAVVWYQGESNADNPTLYGELLPRFITSCRQLFGQDVLPFVIVQLPRFMPMKDNPSESEWASLREVQRLTALSLPKVGLAVTIDTGEWNDIHPLDKKIVADRVARELFRLSYGDDESFSPQIETAISQGDALILQFNTGKSTLAAGNEIHSFSVAGCDSRFVWAKVMSIDEDKVVLQSPVSQPVWVRYAWADNPQGDYLYNKEGIPVSPFEVKISPSF
ncbi:MAG: beta galactosidase jelly roll domain-containing protein [Porphyromonadaceae bacterium]|nr:beta galactosidase jelly roll domain-containing protein [Porphyromonadaceae bacterium]